jgi:hypothetical protein
MTHLPESDQRRVVHFLYSEWHGKSLLHCGSCLFGCRQQEVLFQVRPSTSWNSKRPTSVPGCGRYGEHAATSHQSRHAPHWRLIEHVRLYDGRCRKGSKRHVCLVYMNVNRCVIRHPFKNIHYCYSEFRVWCENAIDRKHVYVTSDSGSDLSDLSGKVNSRTWPMTKTTCTAR